MFISSVYLSTYSQPRPIDGRFTIKDEGFEQVINFTPEECAVIQDLCSQALERVKAEAASKLLSASISVPLLEAPEEPEAEDADFSEVPF